MGIINHIKKKIIKLLYRPIRVYCFHQATDVFDESTMYKCDWMQIDEFKSKILSIQKRMTFIPLEEAYVKLKTDKYRLRNYAVLTADDGWASIKCILPWLKEKNVPITLFLNPYYFDGLHYREKATERFLLNEDILMISKEYPNVSIGSHGWNHRSSITMTESEFKESVLKSLDSLRKLTNWIPFFAYTYGFHSESTDAILRELNLVPVLINGGMNYKLSNGMIDREEL